MNVNLGYIFYKEEKGKVWIGPGFSFQHFEYEVSDVDRAYSTGAYPGALGYAPGKYRTYDVTHTMPNLGFGLDLQYGKYSVAAQAAWSPAAQSVSTDKFILCDTKFKTKDTGSYYMANIKAVYDWSKNWNMGIIFDYAKVNTDGERKEYNSGAYVSSIDHTGTSETMRFMATFGYSF
mgnify:CR=1 FL=1